MFEFKTYSDEVLNFKSKIEGLNNLYEPVFLKFIKKTNSLDKKEEALFDKGINEIALYILNTLLFKIRVGTSSRLEIKIATLYTKYCNLHEDNASFYYKISEDLFDIAKDSIYQSVGIPDKNKAFKKVKSGNLVSYIQTIFLYKTLNLLDKEVNGILSITEDKSNLDSKELTVDEILVIEELLEIKKVKYIFGQDKYNEIKEIMISGTEIIPKNLVKILEYIKKE